MNAIATIIGYLGLFIVTAIGFVFACCAFAMAHGKHNGGGQ